MSGTSASTLRSEAQGGAQRLPRGDGRAEITWGSVNGATRLRHLYQRTPCRVFFPGAGRAELTTAVVLTTSGGLAGGDRIGLDIAVRRGAKSVVTTQAAEKIYRSAGDPCTVDVRITAEEKTWLEWMPQETILFNGARLRRATTIRATAGARFMAGEILVFGRLARGEVFRNGALRDAWTVERDGKRVWMEALRFGTPESTLLDHAVGMDGARSLATAVYIADDAPEQIETARRMLRGGRCRGGVNLRQRHPRGPVPGAGSANTARRIHELLDRVSPRGGRTAGAGAPGVGVLSRHATGAVTRRSD